MRMIFVFFVFLSLPLYAANSFYLLSYEEFKSLKPQQQTHYLKQVQKILSRMTQKTLYMANKTTPSSRVPASDPVSSSDDLSPGYYIGSQKITVQKPKPIEPIQPQAYSQPIPNHALIEKDLPLLPPSSPQKKTSTAPTQKTNSSIPLAESLSANEELVSVMPAASPHKKEITQNTAHPSSIVPLKESLSPGETLVEPSPSSQKGQYRCIYSGWVVETDPCSPQRQFPTEFKLNGIDSKQMKCSRGQTLCQPFVFGLKIPSSCQKLSDCKDKAEPICVQTGAWPTVDCYQQSTMKETRSAATLILENKDQYNHYMQQVSDLCDPNLIDSNPFLDPQNRKSKRASAAAVKYDILQTCGWAKTQLKQVFESLNIPYNEEKSNKWSESHNQKGSSRCGKEGYCQDRFENSAPANLPPVDVNKGQR